MNSNIKVVLLSGEEINMPRGYKLYDSKNYRNINSLFNNQRIKLFTDGGGEVFGMGNKCVFDKETGNYSLVRDGEVLIDNCDKILPICKKSESSLCPGHSKDSQHSVYGRVGQRGIIYCEGSFNDGNNCFLRYKINKNGSFEFEKTRYLMFNSLEFNFKVVKNYHYDQDMIMSYIKLFIMSHEGSFTTLDIYNLLVENNLIDPRLNNNFIISKIFTCLIIGGYITQTKEEDGITYYAAVKENCKIKNRCLKENS